MRLVLQGVKLTIDPKTRFFDQAQVISRDLHQWLYKPHLKRAEQHPISNFRIEKWMKSTRFIMTELEALYPGGFVNVTKLFEGVQAPVCRRDERMFPYDTGSMIRLDVNNDL